MDLSNLPTLIPCRQLSVVWFSLRDRLGSLFSGRLTRFGGDELDSDVLRSTPVVILLTSGTDRPLDQFKPPPALLRGHIV